jgi:hypothetical protein
MCCKTTLELLFFISLQNSFHVLSLLLCACLLHLLKIQQYLSFAIFLLQTITEPKLINFHVCMSIGFCSSVGEVTFLLKCGAALLGIRFLTFWHSVVALSSTVKMSKKNFQMSETNYPVMWHHVPEEQRLQYSYMLKSVQVIYWLNTETYWNQQARKTVSSR